MPDSQAGVAASVASASPQAGSALGVAITGSIVASASNGHLAAASHPAWTLLAFSSLAVAVIGYASTGARARKTARRVRKMLTDDVPEPKERQHEAPATHS